jgi:hypothetical protein
MVRAGSQKYRDPPAYNPMLFTASERAPSISELNADTTSFTAATRNSSRAASVVAPGRPAHDAAAPARRAGAHLRAPVAQTSRRQAPLAQRPKRHQFATDLRIDTAHDSRPVSARQPSARNLSPRVVHVSRGHGSPRRDQSPLQQVPLHHAAHAVATRATSRRSLRGSGVSVLIADQDRAFGAPVRVSTDRNRL